MLYRSMNQFKELKLETLNSSDRQSATDAIIELKYAIEGRTIGNTLDSIKDATVCKGPDWSSAEILDDSTTGTVAKLHSDGSVDVRWDKSPVLVRLKFGGNDKYEVMLSKPGPRRPIHQTLARAAGLHSSVLRILQQEKAIGERAVECTNLFLACNDLLTAFATDEPQNCEILCQANQINVICGHLGKQHHAEDVLSVIIDSSTAYRTLSLSLIVQKVVQCIRSRLDSKDMKEKISDLLDVLISLLPNTQSVTNLNPEEEEFESLRPVQKYFFFAVFNAIEEFKSFFSHPGQMIVSSSGMPAYHLKLFELLSRCLVQNESLQLFCTNKFKFDFERAGNLFVEVDKTTYGLSNRLFVMKALTDLLGAIDIKFESTGQSLNPFMLEQQPQTPVVTQKNRILVLENELATILRREAEVCNVIFSKANSTDTNRALVTAESKHDYDDNSDLWTEIYVPFNPQTQHVQVVFSPETVTERTHDYVQILKVPESWNSPNATRKYSLIDPQTTSKGEIPAGAVVEVSNLFVITVKYQTQWSSIQTIISKVLLC
ncbi:unnamed protein product [Sphagnum balticum]